MKLEYIAAMLTNREVVHAMLTQLLILLGKRDTNNNAKMTDKQRAKNIAAMGCVREEKFVQLQL